MATEILSTAHVSSIERFLLDVALIGDDDDEDDVSVFRNQFSRQAFGERDWLSFRQTLRRCSSLRTVTFKAKLPLQLKHIRGALRDALLDDILRTELAEWDELGMLEVCSSRVPDNGNSAHNGHHKTNRWSFTSAGCRFHSTQSGTSRASPM